MTLAALLLALLCICAYSWFFALRFRVVSGAAPLTAIAFCVLWLCLSGYAGFLWFGCFSLYLGGLAALAFCIWKSRKIGWKKALSVLDTPGFLLFFSVSLFFCCLMAYRQTMFNFWDEFSFWGTASKVTHLHDALYPAVPNNLAGKLAYPPAIPLVSYFAQFWSPVFCDWAAMAGYNMVLCACFGTVLSGLGSGQRKIGFLGGTICILLPLFFEPSAITGGFSFVYRTVLSETFLGCLFGGTLAIWFTAKEKDERAAIPFIMLLGVLSFTKDAGLVLAAAASMIAGLDLLIFYRKKFHFFCLKGWKALLSVILLVILMLAFAYPSWNIYFGAVTEIDRTAGDGSAGLTMQQVLIHGLGELLGINRTPRFTETLQNMAAAYFKIPVSVFGGGFLITLIVLAVCVGGFFALKNQQKGSAALYFATGFIGLLGMMAFNLFAYVYVFYESAGLQLIDYFRYQCFYYLGWLLGACSFFFTQSESKETKLGTVGLAVTVCLAGMVFVPLSHTILAPNLAMHNTRALIHYRAEEMREVCKDNDKIFLVSQFDDASRWYQYAYELEPLCLLPMLGNTLVHPGTEMCNMTDAVPLTPEEFREALQKMGCTYVYLDQAGEYDTQGYTALFTDGMQAYQQHGVRLYRAVTEKGKYALAPCGKTGERP